MSDFDNFDDLDEVRDFRSLSNPYPGAIDDAVRQRLLALAAARGYRPGAPARRDGGPGSSGAAGITAEAPTTGYRQRRPAAVELSGMSPERPRRYHRCMVAVSIGLAVVLVAGALARRETPGQSLELAGGTEVTAPAGAGGAALEPQMWRALVAAQPDRPLVSGQYEHRRYRHNVTVTATVSRDGSFVDELVNRSVEVDRWAAVDESGRWRHRSLDQRSPMESPLTALPVERGFDGVSHEALRLLPADAAGAVEGLRAQLEGGEAWAAGSATKAALFGLGQAVVPPGARSALVDWLDQQGLEPNATASDGHGFRLVDATGVWMIVVDGAGLVSGWDHRPRIDAPPDEQFFIALTEVVDRLPV